MRDHSGLGGFTLGPSSDLKFERVSFHLADNTKLPRKRRNFKGPKYGLPQEHGKPIT